MRERKRERIRAGYDAVAEEYARRIYDELRHKPLDRELLDRFAERVRGAGRAWDMGCGPGQVARYLQDRGVDVCGVDISRAMVERAARLNPGIAFLLADMLSLAVADGAWAGIAAFYSLIHFSGDQVVQALREFRRVLRPGGVLLLAFHVGDETVHRDELWGIPVSLDFVFFRSRAMAGHLASAGFAVERIIERDPYPEVEYPSRRSYILARKPEEPAEDPGGRGGG